MRFFTPVRLVRSVALVTVAATTLAVTPAVAIAASPPSPGSALTGSAAPPDPATLREDIAKITAAGATAALARVTGKAGSWHGASGVADLITRKPADDGGRFRVGSVTKTVVSTVVLQLVAEDKVGLDDSIERYLPGLVPNGKAMTWRHVLTHTAGLYNYTDALFPMDDPNFGVRWITVDRWRTYSPRRLVKTATDHPPYFPPGKGWHYSNTGYVLAGLLIEKVTGNSYAAEVKRRILRPLGMAGTSLPGTSPFIPSPHAKGYVELNKIPVDVTEENLSWAFSAGEIISTTADLDRFNAALLGGKLLPPAQLRDMKTTVDTSPGYGYGLGLAKQSLPCGTVWGHNGGVPGYVTELYGTADGGRQVALSYNPRSVDPRDNEKLGKAVQTFFAHAFCGRSAGGDGQPLMHTPREVW